MKQKDIFSYMNMLQLFLCVCLPVCFAVSAKAQHWTPEISSYENYMTVTGYVIKNNVELSTGDIEVGCFIDNQCRGTCKLKQTENSEHPFKFYLSVWGSSADNGKQITFSVYDSDEKTEYNTNEQLLYQYQGIVGNDSPYKLVMLTLLDITVNAATGGTLDCPVTKAFPGDTINFTVLPETDYELNHIEVLPQSTEIQQAGGSFSFVMPNDEVTLTPVFRKISDRTIAESAAALLENASFSLYQSDGNTEEEVKEWLVDDINLLIASTGITVSADDLVINNFIPATEGHAGNKNGINGSFDFTADIKQGNFTTTTKTLSGIIHATSHTGLNYSLRNSLHVITIANGLYITGINQGEAIRVYNMNGMLLYENEAKANNQIVMLHDKGVYVVEVGIRKMKVIF